MNRAVVGVGSNIDPRRHIARAKELLSREQRLLRESAFVTTSPIGFASQPDFVNGAFLIETDLGSRDFTAYLKSVESRLGRVRTENKNGPRTIDLDLIVWNGSIVNDDYHQRDFLRKAVDEVSSVGQLPRP